VNEIAPTASARGSPTPRCTARYAQHPELVDADSHNTLLTEFIEPDDIADAALWLWSDLSRFIASSTLSVDAGFCEKV